MQTVTEMEGGVNMPLPFILGAAAAAAAFFLSGNLVGILGIDGAALCYLLLMAGETAGFGLCTVKSCRSEEKEIRQ